MERRCTSGSYCGVIVHALDMLSEGRGFNIPVAKYAPSVGILYTITSLDPECSQGGTQIFWYFGYFVKCSLSQ